MGGWQTGIVRAHVAARWLAASRGIDRSELEDRLDEAESKREAEAILDEVGAREVKLPNRSVVWVVGRDLLVEGERGSYYVSELDDWVWQQDLSDLFPDEEDRFNDDFWSSPPPLYHATTPGNVEDIEADGLRPMSLTRGITNRGTGPAVFTTSEPDEAFSGSYGPVVYEIDTKAMKAGGDKPFVSMEEPVLEGELIERLGHLLGVDIEPDVEQGMSPYTVVVHGRIAPEYLTRVD